MPRDPAEHPSGSPQTEAQYFDPLAVMVGEFARDFVAPEQRIDAIDRLYVLLREARTAASARREPLDVEAALLRYGRHEEGCPDYFTEPPWQSCHCGWTDVLARLSSIPAREEE